MTEKLGQIQGKLDLVWVNGEFEFPVSTVLLFLDQGPEDGPFCKVLIISFTNAVMANLNMDCWNVQI